MFILSCADSGSAKMIKSSLSDIKEENISKNEGTIFHLYLGSEEEKEKMEWNEQDCSIKSVNQSGKWLVLESIGKFGSC